MNQLSEKDLHMHVSIVAWLNIIANSVFLLLGLCGFVFFAGLGVFAAADSGDAVALPILGLIGTVGLLFFGLLALPGILAGYGLLKRKKWGQILGIVDGILNLFAFPIGTALGAYALFVLFQNSANDYFDGQEAEPA
jgi:1,4-dihydroxy-2-naphthoate octaprenyltransferase